MAHIKVYWLSVGNTVLVRPTPQETDIVLRDSAIRGFRRTLLPGAVDLVGQSVGLIGESELQLNINVLYRAYLVQ